MLLRRKVNAQELKEFLVTQTSVILGHDARFIKPHLKIRRCDGNPNWSAELDIFAGVIITGIFNEARDRAAALYELNLE
jgi:hypothetical protein